MKLYATRITEGADLKEAVIKFALDKQLSSAVVASGVGSLSSAKLRMAGAKPEQQDIRTFTGTFEIVSLTGTIASDGKAHLHISISDTDGNVFGGHLKEGCTVHTTVELVLVSDDSMQFTRELDESTGFDELKIEEM